MNEVEPQNGGSAEDNDQKGSVSLGTQSGANKKCSYCGGENERDALVCRKCGNNEFRTSELLPAASKSASSAKCFYCGVESELVQAFFKGRKSFSRKIQTVCPTCWTKRRSVAFKRGLVIYGILAGVGLLLVVLFPRLFFGWVILNSISIDIFLALSLLPHELGHALIAKLMGFRVFYIVVGSGKKIGRKKLLGFNIEFRTVPLSGATITAPRDEKFFRLRYAAVLLAGPLINVILGVAAWLLIQKGVLRVPIPPLSLENAPLALFNLFGTGLVPLHMIVLANLLLVAINLWPRHIRTALGKIPSDGLALVTMPFLPRKKSEAILASYYLYGVTDLFGNKDHAAAQRYCEEGLKRFPENEHLLSLKGVNFLALRKFPEARECFAKLLERPAQDPMSRLVLLNNLAYANHLIGGAELLKEADHHSKYAMEQCPWVPLFKGTRGCVLIELNRIEEGISLLLDAMQNHEDPESKAMEACHLAIGEKKRGNFEESRRYVEMARQFDPNCTLLEWVEV
jgi:ribosomal protein L40E